MSNGYDPAAFDIVRDDYREIDQRDYRDDRFQEREQEREPRMDDRDIPSPSKIETVRQAMETIVNDDSVTLDDNMVRAINDPGIRMTRSGELTRRLSDQFSRANLLRIGSPTKKKRKVSKYQKELGRQLKMLKKKHPRTRISNLMKRAHRLTRKALK